MLTWSLEISRQGTQLLLTCPQRAQCLMSIWTLSRHRLRLRLLLVDILHPLVLLPGMYSSPVHAVPKPPDTFWLINHQSYGDHSLNSMILREDVAGTCMDGIRSLGTVLLCFWEEYGDDIELVIYKSNISHVYWNFWVHPLWQIKQIVSVGTEWYVNWCNCFRGCASYLIFLSFSSLLAWIT